jgi:hypothetical protein
MAGPDGPVQITDYQYKEHFLHMGEELPQEPEIPPYGVKWWDVFWKLHARRRPGFEFPAPLSYGDIQTFSLLTQTRITPDDVDILTRMDDAYLSAVADGIERKRTREERANKAKGKK